MVSKTSEICLPPMYSVSSSTLQQNKITHSAPKYTFPSTMNAFPIPFPKPSELLIFKTLVNYLFFKVFPDLLTDSQHVWKHRQIHNKWSVYIIEPCAPGPRRKEKWLHKRLSRTCLWVSGSLWQRRGSVVACCRVGGTECFSACMRPFERGLHCLHYLHHSLAPGKQQGGNTDPPINRKLD